MNIKLDKIENAWNIILDTLFEDYDWRNDDNLKGTPKRIAKSMVFERCSGIGSEQKCIDLLKEQFPTNYDGIITIGPLTVHSICPHHFENIIYSVYFGYIPRKFGGTVVGLSKPGRVIKLFARQPILQEEYTKILANIFMGTLKPDGLGLIVEGKHMCMSARGLEQPNTLTITSEMRGTFRHVKTIKDEFMDFYRRNK